ncbi:MAG: hypothetical protein JNK26_05150 [Candidatus Doudnabacteria bacterium]|nr:hypothetical protein [Candidatus Doudnabacteria bacterium]
MKRFLRKILRLVLGWLAKVTLHKHQPLLIAIVGDGPTSVMREVMVAALQESIATRRNVELPEAEFSVPLTVLDYPFYPTRWYQWVWLLVKTGIQFLTVKSYYHGLVLELHPINSAAWQYWLQILNPAKVVCVGDFDYPLQGVDAVKLNFSLDRIEIAIDAAKALAAEFGVDSVDSELGLAQLEFPTPRLRVLPQPSGVCIVDATHYYFPIKINAVREMLPALGARVVLLSSLPEDLAVASGENWVINPPLYEPQKDDVVLLRGVRTDVLSRYERFLSIDIN